eukprot:tig00000017_g12.t1
MQSPRAGLRPRQGGATLLLGDIRKAQEWAGERACGPEGFANDEIARAATSSASAPASSAPPPSAAGRAPLVSHQPCICIHQHDGARGQVNGVVAVKWAGEDRAVSGEERTLFEDVCEAVGIALAQADLVKAAQAAARAKADFLSVVTHEMRTPMQAVLGLTDLMLGCNPARPSRVLQIIRSSAQALVDLVGEVLDASALERGGRLLITTGPFDLRACAQDVMDLMWPVTASKNSRFSSSSMHEGTPRFIVSTRPHPAGRAPPSRTFAHRTASDRCPRAVMINLVGNAAKVSEAGGRVVVEVLRPRRAPVPAPAALPQRRPELGARPGSRWRPRAARALTAATSSASPSPARRPSPRPPAAALGLRLSDERLCRARRRGAGISDEDQQKLFAFFTQLDASKSRRYHGTGLGLFISMNIARALEGGIALVSTPGSGSTFAFTFRAEPAPPADDLRPLPVPSSPALRSPRPG